MRRMGRRPGIPTTTAEDTRALGCCREGDVQAWGLGLRVPRGKRRGKGRVCRKDPEPFPMPYLESGTPALQRPIVTATPYYFGQGEIEIAVLASVSPLKTLGWVMPASQNEDSRS